MSARSLNKVQLIGNLTRDPELRYTPTGAAVCTVGLATNRSWTTEAGDKKEETEFHRVVAWNKLAELCSQLLTKGRKVYVEGRLRTVSWQGQDGNQRTTTEVVIEDMILLDSRRPLETPPLDAGSEASLQQPVPAQTIKPSSTSQGGQTTSQPGKSVQTTDATVPPKTPEGSEDVNPDDIPF